MIYCFFLQVSADCLRPHVAELIAVLLECFRDDSWPVRDGEHTWLLWLLLCTATSCQRMVTLCGLGHWYTLSDHNLM